MNILWLSRKGADNCCAPQTRHEFEQEVAKVTNSRFIGEGWEGHIRGESLRESVERVMPDVDWVIDRDNNLKEIKPLDIRVGHFISDLHGKHHYNIRNAMDHIRLLNKTGYSAIFMRYVSNKYRQNLLPSAYWVPWSVNSERYYPRERLYDVACMGATDPRVYPLRSTMMLALSNLKGYETLTRLRPLGTTFERPRDSEYPRLLGSCGIHIFDCSRYLYPLQKFFEGMASGCLVMSTKPNGAEKLGFIDEKTYVEIDKNDWRWKLDYYLENPDLATRIATKGMEMVRKYHTHEVRAKQFVRYLEDGIERGL